MNGGAVIYHFTKKENLQSIFREGLVCSSKIHSLGSKLRSNAIYFWLSPADDGMGYNGNDEYECLQVSVDSDLCMVANMDLISAAFVNFIMEKENEALYDYKRLASLYDSSAVKYEDYSIGLFRAPEVIVQGNISPKQIRVAQISADEDSYASNRDAYNKKIVNQITALKLLQKIAVHDDSTGLLTTYKFKDSDSFVTIEEMLERDFVH